jgi:nicotinamide-nucleotide amidase
MPLFPADLVAAAGQINALLRARGLTITTAESCTGGLVAGLLTEIAGSSDVVDRGFVTYSNRAKEDLLGVPPALLERHGAVSPETAESMALGALAAAPQAAVAVAITGIAGPGGATREKPVGLVYIAAARRDGAIAAAECRFGDIGRTEVRIATLRAALELVRQVLG